MEGLTDHLVLDGVTALSVNLGVMRPIITALGDRTGTVTVLGQTSFSARGIREALDEFDAYAQGTLKWSEPGGLDHAVRDRRCVQEQALVKARDELARISVPPSLPRLALSAAG
jgi:hypothetical protein